MRRAPPMLFFPAAALYGAIVLPWSVLAMTGSLAGPASLSTPPGHAHELLLGYTLAVIAGYQLPRVSTARLLLLFGAWIVARVAFLALPHSIASAGLNAAFAAAVALHVAPRLLRAAKKARNQALPVLLAAACAIAAAYALALLVARASVLDAILGSMILILAGLMLFMGGRMLAPAIAGELYRQGRSLAARVQPRIEAALLVAIAVAVAAALLALDPLMRAACAAAGLLASVRLVRWQPWTCVHRPDLLRLLAGYAWLAAGLLAVAITPSGALRIAALHVITVGALGTLTFNVMSNVTAARSRRVCAREGLLVAGTALIAVATICRFAAAPLARHAGVMLDAAAACWSAAFLMLFGVLLRDALARAQRPVQPSG